MSPDTLAEPHVCWTAGLPAPARGAIFRCVCGQWWVAAGFPDIFTSLTTLRWKRVGWWDFGARWRIARNTRVPR